MNVQLAGLASGFDWKSFVDTIMDLERAPINRLLTEKNNNTVRNTVLGTLDTNLKNLRSSVAGLAGSTTFATRTATVSGGSSTWSAAASTTAAAGTTAFNIIALASAARREGAAGLASPLAASADVSGVSLASLGTSVNPTAGFFTVNGAQVTVDLGASLQDLFDAISTATGGAVTAGYDSGTDGITLASASPITLGAANDTSNFLAVARLTQNGSGTISSSTGLGALKTGATLDNARLASAVTAVDGSGNGSFTLNGVAIDYNLTTDSLAAVMARINSSSAGVKATYDAAADRMVLTNAVTGDLSINVSEAAGGLLGALGLSTGATTVAGTNARFTVNNGPEISATRNTLDEADHGVAGLSLTATTTGTADVTVASDTGGMRSKIDAFITAYNNVQSFIETESKVTSTNGKVTTSTLSTNREVQSWATALRRSVFDSVPGLDGAIARLENLGIDFVSGSDQLQVNDSAKLDAALADRSDDVVAFFQQSSTGFTARLDALLDNYLGVNGATGQVETQRTLLNTSNTSLDQQIADIERRLVQRRSLLESGFIAMERAQAQLQQMQTQLNNAFPSNSGSTKK